MIKKLKNIDISKVSIFIVIITILFIISNNRIWEKDTTIDYDVRHYYVYLPAAFVYQDFSFSFLDGTEDVKGSMYKLTSPNGKYYTLTTCGVSMLYAPFFAVGHIIAHIGDYETNGYSNPYRFMVVMSSVFYLFLGLFFLRKVLLTMFSKHATAITLFALGIGTNIIYYSTYLALMTHVYNFSMFCIFIFLLIRWLNKPAYLTSLLFGLVGGLITLIRPTNVLILILIPLWGISSGKDLKQRFFFLLQQYKKLIIFAISAIAICTPQLVYWKYISGEWFFNTYAYFENSGSFFFGNPQIFKGLFSYRKGWFVYTPVMFFAVIGIITLLRTNKKLLIPVLTYIILNTYVIFSWWCWWYGGSFGQRALIASYSIMAFPLASFIDYGIKNRKLWTKIITLSLISISIILNVFFYTKYYYGSIHWDSMTKKAFWSNFLNIRPNAEFSGYLETLDYVKARNGIYVVEEKKEEPQKVIKPIVQLTCNMEELNSDSTMYVAKEDSNVLFENVAARSTEKAHSGTYSVKLTNEDKFALKCTISNVKPGEIYKFSVWKTEGNGSLIVSDENNQKLYKKTKSTKTIDGEWQQLSLDLTINEDIDYDLIVYVWFPEDNGHIYFDDLTIEKY